MNIGRSFAVLGIAEAIVLAIYVLDQPGNVDLGAATTPARIVVVLTAALVAVLAYHAWSRRNSVHTICAMLLGLLGGASLVSAVSTARGAEVFGSGPMALAGTVAVVLSVVVSQIGLTRTPEASR